MKIVNIFNIITLNDLLKLHINVQCYNVTTHKTKKGKKECTLNLETLAP